MKLTLSDPKYLRDTISIISELVNETNLKITPDGIELIAMDPANVAMAILKILSSSFVDYDVDKQVSLAINLNSLKQILKRSKPNDLLTLEIGKDNKLKITLKGNSTRTFSLPIIDIDEKDVLFKITDEGIGIDDKEIKFIFTNFYRTESSRKADTEGLGIGLHLSRIIVEKHGGKIWVESAGPEKGSTFFVLLPIHKS